MITTTLDTFSPTEPRSVVLPPSTASELAAGGDAPLAARLAALAGAEVSAEQAQAALALQGVILALVEAWQRSLDEERVADNLARSGQEPPIPPWSAPFDTVAPRGWLTVQVLAGSQSENPAMGALREVLVGSEVPGMGSSGGPLLDRLLYTEPLPELGLSLVQAVRSLFAVHPHSLVDQLRWAATHWHGLLPEAVRQLALGASDALHEVSIQRGGGGPGPAPVLEFGDPGPGPDNFSEDQEWMPQLVLVAKHSLVWLDQLSKRYGRPIHTLADIPDAELDELASRGFTGLWLIGLWERSPASREIKRRMGNPEAEASAYSLTAYRIAERLGGDGALENLRWRARQRGIRLCADMVPNHTAVDSEWVLHHPERFVQLSEPPWADYAFTGPDLSSDGRVGIWLEDGYWSRSGAAVVFKRLDRHTGEVRYLYHGNDGTQMPWNDTAQLDYSRADVREAVIQTILCVASRFDAIRFDAAMTLARKHVQRLWHPVPGDAGAIPSRARFGLSPDQFDAAMPGEFWREVVDRVAAEQEDTLLLAEAFWLLEGYFVRDLGMHRVYNSAFMNMLRDEDNAGYHTTLKNTLAYSPAIMERYVNFVSNPDEAPAAAHFGKGDKYFGITTLLSTLPGLPMFGHGQFEGFSERYGMEYARAYTDEGIDQGLVHWHERVISPLLRQRERFAGVRWFTLYAYESFGHVDEDVFAFSNRDPQGGRPSLVLYNNRQQPARGRVLRSVPFNTGTAAEPRLETRTLAAALGLPEHGQGMARAEELVTGAVVRLPLSTLLSEGFTFDLPGYGYRVFLDWRLETEADRLADLAAAEVEAQDQDSPEDAAEE